MFEFSEMDCILMEMVQQNLVELSVDETGEFIFYCTTEQKEALELLADDIEEEQGW